MRIQSKRPEAPGTTQSAASSAQAPAKPANPVADAIVSQGQGAPISIQGPTDPTPLIPGRIKSVKLGSYQALAGKIENRAPMGIGGEAPPSGSYLVLDKPIKVSGVRVKELYLQGPELPEGQSVKLNGRLDLVSYGGVETHGASVHALSGISNLGAGEPRFDGQGFKNAGGKKLEVLSYSRPLMYDAPARIFVLDGNKAFFGSMGGHIPPNRNPFHGFSRTLAVESATDADRKAVKSDAEGRPLSVASGKPLERISREQPVTQPYPDQMFHAWYFDAEANMAYRLASGGIAGFQNRATEVIRLG
ncbi:MAG: hypothetical protein HYV07_21235 [Deltaproteobacteria bacterium]|nr:hypothetical protein [Deltaproteobacteria bacterium]